MRRLVVLLALLAVVVSGCGGDDSSDSGPSTDSAVDGAGGGDDGATAPDDLCGAVPAEDVGAALGATVTGEEQPGGGCSYDQEDPRAVSVAITTIPTTADNGGYEMAVSGATGGLSDPESTDVTGAGDGAVVVSGQVAGFGSSTAVGLADLGGFAVMVQVLGGDAAAHAAAAEAVLRLAVDRLG